MLSILRRERMQRMSWDALRNHDRFEIKDCVFSHKQMGGRHVYTLEHLLVYCTGRVWEVHSAPFVSISLSAKIRDDLLAAMVKIGLRESGVSFAKGFEKVRIIGVS